MTSVLHDHRDRMKRLFVAPKFRDTALDLKNKGVTFLRPDIHVLCGNTRAQPAVWKK